MASITSALQEDLQAYFADKPEITAAFVFGSAARGEERPDSDIDLAILLHHGASLRSTTRSAMIAELMGLCRRDRIDVVILNGAPPLLQHRVLRDGHVVFCRDQRSLAEFTIRAVQRYEDTRPLRALQAQRLRKRLTAEGSGGL